MEDLDVKLDRQTIRTLAENHSTELQNVANSGGNHYQTALEQQDKINELVNRLNENDSIIFMNMYAEELDACSNKKIDDANKLLIEAQVNEQNADAIGGVIAVVIILFILFFAFK